MTTERATYEKINAEFWRNAREIDAIDDLRNDLDVNHFRDADYAEKRAAADARREELIAESREIGARLKTAKKAMVKNLPVNALFGSFRK